MKLWIFVKGLIVVAAVLFVSGCSQGGLDPIGGLPGFDNYSDEQSDSMMRHLQVPTMWGIIPRPGNYSYYTPGTDFWADKCEYLTERENLLWSGDKHASPSTDPGFWEHEAQSNTDVEYNSAHVAANEYDFDKLKGLAHTEGDYNSETYDWFFSSVKVEPQDRGDDEKEDKIFPPWHGQLRSQYYYIYHLVITETQQAQYDHVECIGYYNGPTDHPAIDVAFNDDKETLALIWWDSNTSKMNQYFLVENGTHPDGLIKWEYRAPLNEISTDEDDALAIDTVDDLFFLLEKDNGGTKTYVKVYSIATSGSGWALTAITDDTLDDWQGVDFDYVSTMQPEIAVRSLGSDVYRVSFIAGRPDQNWDDNAYIYLYDYDYSQSAGSRWTFLGWRKLNTDGGTVAFETDTNLSSCVTKAYMAHYTYTGSFDNIVPAYDDETWSIGPVTDFNARKTQYLDEEELVVYSDTVGPSNSQRGFWTHEPGTSGDPDQYDDFTDHVADVTYTIDNIVGLDTTRIDEDPSPVYDHIFSIIDTNMEGYRIWGLRFDPDAGEDDERLTVAGKSEIISAGGKVFYDVSYLDSPLNRGDDDYIVLLKKTLLTGAYSLDFYNLNYDDEDYVYSIDLDDLEEDILIDTDSGAFLPRAIEIYQGNYADIVFILGVYQVSSHYYLKVKVYAIGYTSGKVNSLTDGEIDLYQDENSFHFSYDPDFNLQIAAIESGNDARIAFIGGSTCTSDIVPAVWVWDIEDDGSPEWDYKGVFGLSNDEDKYGGTCEWRDGDRTLLSTAFEYDYITYLELE